jgi:ADP-heptose:LPS heptosyltransferase
VLMLTAAVRDLQWAHQGRYTIAVDTSCPELWQNNPHIVARDQLGREPRIIHCDYPLVHFSNQRPYHFIHGFAQHLGWRLGVQFPLRAFCGDIHLSSHERAAPSPLLQHGHSGSFWIIVAGGKYDYTAKWWNPAWYQQVVDHFARKIQFVQCGQAHHWHPPLRGVIQMVGKTNLRQFVQLTYHADGVVCPVTFAMHLAAAVPLRPGQLCRHCVVIAGGREPPHWEMYPGHQFLHTVGMLDCCATGGCWKSRCQRVGDRDPKDYDLCVKPVGITQDLQIPRCMHMITSKRVIEAIESYFHGGTLHYLDPPAH